MRDGNAATSTVMINVRTKRTVCELLCVQVLRAMYQLKSKIKRKIYSPSLFTIPIPELEPGFPAWKASVITTYNIPDGHITTHYTLIILTIFPKLPMFPILVISEYPTSFIKPRNYCHQIRCNFNVFLQKLRLACKVVSKPFLSIVHITCNFRFCTSLFFKYATSILLRFPLKGRVSVFKDSKHDAC